MGEVKTWRVTGVVTGSKYLGEVEAATKEEAEAKAFDELDVDCCLCHQCSEECEDAEIQEVYASEVTRV